MLFSRTVWSDWRLILALPVAIGLRFVVDAAYVDALDPESGYDDVHATAAEAAEDRLFEDHAYRPSPGLSGAPGPDWSLSPLTIALVGGGVVFAVGGVVALRMWRDAEATDDSSDRDHDFG